MKKGIYYQYYVEGEDEVSFLQTLKTDMQLIMPGKVQKFNVVEKRFTNARLRTIKANTVVVLVFDTDTNNDVVLNDNIKMLNKCMAVKEIVCVMQVKNIEDELVRCCNIKEIKQLLGSKSNREFKHDLITESNLQQKLLKHGFAFAKLWTQTPLSGFKNLKNEAYKIKH